MTDEGNKTETDEVDDETVVRRQKTAACAAIDHAMTERMTLLVMVFGSEDGESMSVFGIEGVDVSAILEYAAQQAWCATPDQPLRGS